MWYLVGNKIVDHSDVVGAALTGDAPTACSFSTWIGQRQLQDDTRIIEVLGMGATYIRGFMVYWKLSKGQMLTPTVGIKWSIWRPLFFYETTVAAGDS